jgi:DNA-binding NarL/FixJ family response regulator
MARVLIADANLIIREGLKKILLDSDEDIEIVGEVALAQQIPQRMRILQAHAVVMGMTWHGDNHAGSNAIAWLKKHAPEKGIVVIAEEKLAAAEAGRAGADIVLSIYVSQSELLEGIKACLWSRDDGFMQSLGQTDGEAWEIEAVRREIQAHKENLHELELQRAGFGPLNVPLKTINEIQETQKQMCRLEKKLAELEKQIRTK